MAAAFALVSATAFAQTMPEQAGEKSKQEHYRKGHKQGGNWERRMKAYESQLGLSASQVTQWQALHEAKKAEMKLLKTNTALSQEEKKAQMKALHQQQNAELQKILTAEQFAKFQELRKAEREKRQAQAKNRKEFRQRRGGNK